MSELAVAIKWRDARWVPWVVWVLRLSVGALFIMSGLVKAIDIWGTVFKFNEYFVSWNVDVPESLSVLAAMMLSSTEFVVGALLALGCFRRTSVWALLAMMAVMLPLTLYVWLENPVSDCGCFGDYFVISNGATFAKNIVITLALLFLALTNRKAPCLFHPYSQWLCGVACLGFITIVELYGINVQPLVDFRSFPVGIALLDTDCDEDVEFEFVYEKDGRSERFTADALPDSTWTFVDRVPIGGVQSDILEPRTELTITDDDGEDITADVISDNGMEMLVIVPQADRADLYHTSFTNELYQMMNRMGGSLVELTDLPADSIEAWRDGAMAEFPVFHAESTVLKELSRGIVSIVLLKDGVIQWKRNMASIDVEALTADPDPAEQIERLAPSSIGALKSWSVWLAIVLLAILAVDKTLSAIFIRGKNSEAENNCLNLQNDSEANDSESNNEPTEQ